MFNVAAHTEFVLLVGLFQAIEELASNDFDQGFSRHQEFLGRRDPFFLILAQASGRADDMQMWVKSQILRPSMQDGGEARQGMKPRPSGGKLCECLCRSLEEQAVDQASILQG